MPWGHTTHCDWVTTARVPRDFSHIRGQESHPQADTPTSVGPDLRQTLLWHRRRVTPGVVGLGLGTVWWENTQPQPHSPSGATFSSRGPWDHPAHAHMQTHPLSGLPERHGGQIRLHVYSPPLVLRGFPCRLANAASEVH